MTNRRSHSLRVKVPHYVALTIIGALALFPMWFMAVTGLKNGIQLEQNPFSLAINHPFGIFYRQAWDYIDGDLLRTVLITAASVAGIIILGNAERLRLRTYGVLWKHPVVLCNFRALADTQLPHSHTFVPRGQRHGPDR